MNFKKPSVRQIVQDKKQSISLDNTHTQIIQEFKEQEENIPKFQQCIREKKAKIKQLTNKNKNAYIEQILDLQDEIKDLKKKIRTIQQSKKKYLLQNTSHIFSYFEDKQKIIQDVNKKQLVNDFFRIKEPPKSEIQLMAEKYKKENEERKIHPSRRRYEQIKAKGFGTSGVKSHTKQYLQNIDDKYLCIDDYIDNHEKCDICGGEMVLVDSDGVLICKNCARQEKFLVEHEKPSYKEPPKEVSFYAYRRINHFREILAQFQAKETTQIDDAVIEAIQKQIRKERITKEQLTNEKTKQILKNLGYNKYYEHIPFIKEKLGIRPPTMSVELENTLCNLFLQIQKPYAKYCPYDRVNFLNYYYVLYKMCELLGEDKYLPHFKMLKDPMKIIEEDEIWKKICEDLEWEFIPTP